MTVPDPPGNPSPMNDRANHRCTGEGLTRFRQFRPRVRGSGRACRRSPGPWILPKVAP
jgi:hypothetical protein